MKMLGGLFQTDKNKKFWSNAWMLISRWTWESPQFLVGYGYFSFRNFIGKVDRVDYFGGATFVTNENASDEWGIALGNYIIMNIRGKITGDFENYVINNPLCMHEFGHMIDSQTWGLAYLFAIGIPSLMSAMNLKLITQWDGKPVNNYLGLFTHQVYWTEMRANRRAAKYFKEHYGIDWKNRYPDYPLENPF